MKIKLNIHQHEYELDITKQGNTVRVTRDGDFAELTVREIDGANYVVEHDSRLLRFAGTTEGSQRQLWFKGHTIRYEQVVAAKAKADATTGSLSSNIPAVVSKLLVQVGDTVQAGDKLILLESMKMVIPIATPQAGVVREIKCAEGEAIQPNVSLIVVEPPT